MATNEERWKRGAEMIAKVYAGDVVTPPRGAMPFSDLMLEQLFAEIWTREELSVKERRLVIMGIIAGMGEKDTFKIQAKSSLKNGELTAEQLREVVITVAQYAGYPRAAGILLPTEEAINEVPEAAEAE